VDRCARLKAGVLKRTQMRSVDDLCRFRIASQFSVGPERECFTARCWTTQIALNPSNPLHVKLFSAASFRLGQDLRSPFSNQGPYPRTNRE